MNERQGWSPTERLLYVAGIPVIAIFSVVLLLTMANSEKKSQSASPAAEQVSMTPAAAAERAREKARQEQREAYRECMKSMGGTFGRSAFRSRFSRPDMSKMRNAAGVCQTALGNGSRSQPVPAQHAATPNTL